MTARNIKGEVAVVFIKIITAVTGLTFLLFGYLIYGKKKYHLINDFEADRQAGHKDEQYAKRVGLIELIIGIVLLLIAIALIVFT